MGMPEHFIRKKKDLFASIVDRIRQKALSWSSKYLFTAGKITMLQSVLSPITHVLCPASNCQWASAIKFN